jgi:hypothetical protein
MFMVIALLAAQPAAPMVDADWNNDVIHWRSYEEGPPKPAQTRKPICLVSYTTWCQHCANFSKVFHSPGRDAWMHFVMVRLNADFEQPRGAVLRRRRLHTAHVLSLPRRRP